TEGIHEGGFYVAIKGYFQQFKEKLGFEPYKGTLNLKLSDTDNELLREKMKTINPIIIEGFKDLNREYGPVKCYDVVISRMDDKNNKRKAAILDIQRTHHKGNIIEILAKPYLRDYFNLRDGDKLIIEVLKD
ncbi:MAG: CTP-dependent riboflavin kinase, partial [Candidatus Lokiarchaeota archaeon]